jgi:hypothetical protein
VNKEDLYKEVISDMLHFIETESVRVTTDLMINSAIVDEDNVFKVESRMNQIHARLEILDAMKNIIANKITPKNKTNESI